MAAERPATGTLRTSETRFGTHHAAFLRALINRLDWRDAAERYLFESYSGRRQVAQLLRELERDFQRAAQLAGRPELMDALPLGRLLPIEVRGAAIIPLHATPPGETKLLNYKEWAAEQRQGFFSEEDLRDGYADYLRERRGPTALLAGRARALGRWNVERALAALRELERHVARPAAPDHACAAWMHPTLSAALAEQGVQTLGELVDYMNRHGHRWYARVARVGRQRARSIARWLSDSPGVGKALTPIATTPRTALTVADFAAVRAGRSPIQPLERLVVPVAMSGIDGTNRERSRVCQIDVVTDRDAIVRWLHGVAVNDNTRRAYSREAERVLQWCLVEKGKPLSSMTVDDAIEYREFLIALPRPDMAWHWQTKRDDWIGAKSHPRTSPNWRPFEGRMSAASIERGLRIVRGLFTWLHEVGYLAGNPWAAVATTLKSHTQFRTSGKPRKKGAEKSLSREEWDAVLGVIDAMPAGERQARAALLVRLGVMAGLRREELANATTQWIEAHGKGRMTLTIVGKGGVPREVPMAAELIAALGDYLEARGLPRDPTECPQQTPLLAKLADEIDLTAPEPKTADERPDPRVALTPARLYAIVRRLIEQAAEVLEGQGDDKPAAKLRRRARAHALRHTFGTQCAEQGIPIPIVQDWMGHASPETTAIYFSTRAGRRFDLIEKAFGTRALAAEDKPASV